MKDRQLNMADKLEFIRDYCNLPTIEAATNSTINHVYNILKEQQDYLEGNDSDV